MEGYRGRIWKNIYPELQRYMEREHYSYDRLQLDLYINEEQARNKLRGRTQFTRLEQERMAEITGIPRKWLFRREEEVSA